jgi:hypothetical protein
MDRAWSAELLALQQYLHRLSSHLYLLFTINLSYDGPTSSLRDFKSVCNATNRNARTRTAAVGVVLAFDENHWGQERSKQYVDSAAPVCH